MGEIAINTTALRGVELNEKLQLLDYVYDQHPENAHLLPIVKALHSCWADEPARILAFFMRDNRELVPHARTLMGLDLLDWSEPMWKTAVESDSWAQFAILVMVEGSHGGRANPPSHPAKGLLEALLDEHYEIAAGYMGFFGKDAVPGIADRWTAFYSTAHESGTQKGVATAQMINGFMKHHLPAVWERDVGKLAAQRSKASGHPLEICTRYLEGEANAFYDASNMALQMYALPQWSDYQHDEPDSELEDDDQEEATPIEGVATGYLLIKQLEEAGVMTGDHLPLVQMMSKAFGLDRSTIAQAVLAEGHTGQSEQEIIADLQRLEIGV